MCLWPTCAPRLLARVTRGGCDRRNASAPPVIDASFIQLRNAIGGLVQQFGQAFEHDADISVIQVVAQDFKDALHFRRRWLRDGAIIQGHMVVAFHRDADEFTARPGTAVLQIRGQEFGAFALLVGKVGGDLGEILRRDALALITEQAGNLGLGNAGGGGEIALRKLVLGQQRPKFLTEITHSPQ